MAEPQDKDDLISQFCSFTGASPSEAAPALASHDWDVQNAVSTWFAQNEDISEGEPPADADMTETEENAAPEPEPTGLVMGGGRTLGGASVPSRAAPSSSSARPVPKAKQSTASKGPRTIKDLQGGHGHEGHGHDDDDSDEDQDFFAGGEKSGLAVQNPNAGPSNPRDQINSILERAKRQAGRGLPKDDEGQQQEPSNRFGGRGVTLGGDDAPSQVVEDPNAAANAARPQRLPRVRRILHLWREGFSVDDGDLFRYDDPANAQTLAMINQGHAPLDLLDVAPGQEVDLELDNQKDHPFVQPKKKYKPFGGSGNRLGSPTPGVATSSAAPTPAVATSSVAASTEAPSVDVNESQPMIQLQIRLGDGTRLRSRFNTTHTVGDVYSFVDASSPASSQRPYALMTTFPNKDHEDKSVQLGDVPELKKGGAVVQKWK